MRGRPRPPGRPVVLVTGASRGIGRQIALAFAEAGWRVAIHYRRAESKARETAVRARKAGGEAEIFQGDVRDAAQVKNLVKEAARQWGRLDVLVNNAGVSRDRTILSMTEEEWREVVDTDLTGAFWCLKSAAGIMARRREGCIINVCSQMGVRGGFGCANYAASKGGLIALTKSAARELGRFGVRVHAVIPGFHPTDMGLAVWEKSQASILSGHVLGRLTDLFELARFVVSLAGYKSISGQVFSFDSRVL